MTALAFCMPQNFFCDRSLNRHEKDILALTVSSALQSDGCYATDRWFAEAADLSEREVSRCFKRLCERGYLFRQTEGRRSGTGGQQRHLIPTERTVTLWTDALLLTREQRQFLLAQLGGVADSHGEMVADSCGDTPHTVAGVDMPATNGRHPVPEEKQVTDSRVPIQGVTDSRGETHLANGDNPLLSIESLKGSSSARARAHESNAATPAKAAAAPPPSEPSPPDPATAEKAAALEAIGLCADDASEWSAKLDLADIQAFGRLLKKRDAGPGLFFHMVKRGEMPRPEFYEEPKEEWVPPCHRPFKPEPPDPYPARKRTRAEHEEMMRQLHAQFAQSDRERARELAAKKNAATHA